MKIVQIVGGGMTSDGDYGPTYGLGNDGNLYEFKAGFNPFVTKVSVKLPDGSYEKNESGFTKYVSKYIDGATRGWKLVCTSDDFSRPIPHPEDPTRHSRS